jgi:predicted exporter
MVIAFRQRVLVGLSIAAIALLGMVAWATGVRRALLILPPVILGLMTTVAVLRLLGVELTLFHLIALMLAAGLGMDYALFFGHADAGDEQRRTLHAVLISAASTAMVFGLLAVSSIPVLKAIGLTVGIGVIAQFILSVLMARSTDTAHG